MQIYANLRKIVQISLKLEQSLSEGPTAVWTCFKTNFSTKFKCSDPKTRNIKSWNGTEKVTLVQHCGNPKVENEKNGVWFCYRKGSWGVASWQARSTREETWQSSESQPATVLCYSFILCCCSPVEFCCRPDDNLQQTLCVPHMVHIQHQAIDPGPLNQSN